MIKNVFLIGGAILFFSCKFPKLSIERRKISPGVIKTNGFYYNKPDFWSFILYENGVFLGDFGVGEKNIESAKRQFSDLGYYENFYKIPSGWGLFEIKNDSIIIAHWENRGWGKQGITKYSGFILNDSSLLLNHPVVGQDTFYFHYLPVKPDSTNKFLK